MRNSHKTMDRHHLLTLLDKLQEKYEIQDGEYKEFAEAIGGKKKPMEFKENDLVRVEYDHIETRADFDGDEMVPLTYVTEKCSTIWKIIPDASEHHVSSRRDTGWSISCRHLKQSEIYISVIKHMANNLSEDLFTICTMDDHRIQHCMRVKSIELVTMP
jgi:hypothetical protein